MRQTTLPSFLRLKARYKQLLPLYVESCLSNSQAILLLNGHITKGPTEPLLRLSHFRYFQSWAFTNIVYMYSFQIHKFSVYRYLPISLKVHMCLGTKSGMPPTKLTAVTSEG